MATSKHKQTTSVATRASTDIVVDERPDYVKAGARGSENVAPEDMIVPRLELVQALSPCKKKTDAGYIEGAEDGMIFNTVTRQLYGESVHIVPVYFRKQWLVFRDRKKGGGFRGSFGTAEEARDQIKTLEAPEEWEAVEAGEHFVLVTTGGSVQQAMLTCTKTKLKVSRQLNSLVQLAGIDRFGRVYELSGKEEQNANGEDYFNFAIKPLGYASERLFRLGEQLWGSVTSGSRVLKTDVSDFDEEEQTGRPGGM